MGSRGFTIWVSSTSFQKSSIGWPQQTLTEKVLKFNGIFRDSTQNFFFSKHPNKAEFNDMDDSEVQSSDFSGLRTSAASMTSTASTTSVASMTSTASFHKKTFNLKKNIYFWWFVTFYYLKKAPKSQNNPNFIKE